MALSDFGALSPACPAIAVSAVESRALGISVGRLDYGLGTDWAVADVASTIASSDLDLLILRYPAERLEVMDAVVESGRRAIPADTLLYFSHSLVGLDRPTSVELQRLGASDVDDSDRLVAAVFDGYRNHYAANPLTRGIDIVRAYQEWSRVSIELVERCAFRAVDGDGDTVGVCLVDCSTSSFEILLAGIVPRRRRAGAYQETLKALLAWASAKGASDVVTSTQAWNISALRAWMRTGFLPTLALSTVHVMR